MADNTKDFQPNRPIPRRQIKPIDRDVNPQLVGPPLPTLEEARAFVRLPWVRCIECGRVTGNKQEQFDEILAAKEDDYYNKLEETYRELIDQGQPENIALAIAEHNAAIFADVSFNKKVSEQLKIPKDRYCCFKTLANPGILPLGAAVGIDPVVEVGERMSRVKLQEKEPTILSVSQGTPQPTKTQPGRWISAR